MNLAQTNSVNGFVESLVLLHNSVHLVSVHMADELLLIISALSRRVAIVHCACEELHARPLSTNPPQVLSKSQSSLKVCLENGGVLFELEHEFSQRIQVLAGALYELLVVLGELEGVTHDVANQGVLLQLLLALVYIKWVEWLEQGCVDALHLGLFKLSLAVSENLTSTDSQQWGTIIAILLFLKPLLQAMEKFAYNLHVAE